MTSTIQETTHSLTDHLQRPALVVMQKDGIDCWTFQKLGEHVERLAVGLADAGIQPGTYCALLAPNGPEWMLACLALVRAGAVPVPIDVQMSDESLTHVLDDSGARWIFTTRTLARHLEKLDLHNRPRAIFLDAEKDDERSWQRLLADQPGRLPTVNPEDPAVLFYTSGTTGMPKGVPLTHRNIASNLDAVLSLNLLRNDDRILLPLPLHHVYPYVIGMLTPLASGAALVLPLSLTGPQVLRTLQEGKVTGIVGVPRLYGALYSAIAARLRQRGRLAIAIFRAALRVSVLLNRTGANAGQTLFRPLHRRFAPHLRIVASGGSALDVGLARKLTGLGWQVATGYGLTETSPLLTFNTPGHGRLESAGRPLPGVDVRTADPQEGFEHGEVLAKGPNVFSGYRNLPEKTEEAFDEQGYFRTGDLGYFDEDGFLHLTGRASSMIVLSGGENIRPDQVEEALARGQNVREAGVLQREDRLVALVVPEPSAFRQRDPEQVERLIREDVDRQNRTLPSHHRVADYTMTRDPLPRTRLGKVQRHKLENRYEESQKHAGRELEEKGPVPIERMAPEDQQLLENPIAREIWNWLAERFAEVRLSPETHVNYDLGVDSMEWLNLTLEIEQQTGVSLSEEAIAEVETVRDLLQQAISAGEAPDVAGRDTVEQLRQPQDLLDDQQRKWLDEPGPLARGLGTGLLVLNRTVMWTLFRLKVQGRQRLPEEPCVLAPNHASSLDPMAISAALPWRYLRETVWTGWTGIMFRNPLMRLVSRCVRVLPIDPRRSPLASLAFGAAALERGNRLVWFPEGHRSPTGELGRFNPGIGLILAAQPVPVVPVWIDGAYEALPRGKRLPSPRQITVTFGEPVSSRELQQSADEEPAHEQIVAALRERVARLGQSE